MDAFRVLSPGSLTTVQDGGRYSFIDRGVPPSGALDGFAYRIANLLVGNPPEAAVLELTLQGPALEVLCEADVALTGADMGATLNDGPVALWKSFRVKGGDILRFHFATTGCRTCLAVSGGIDVPVVMGSRATCLKAKIGGVGGRALKKEDVLRRGAGALLAAPRRLPFRWIPTYRADIVLKALPGPQEDAFRSGMETFFDADYVVTPQSDRMGYRLQGTPIHHDEGIPQSIISEPVLPGNVQLPADGQPIILLVEQTTGGYTKIATVISTDLSKVAQAMPGNRIWFKKVTLEEAHALYRSEAARMKEIEAFFSGTTGPRS
ncbi:MAG TPA: biotin-dependent carboxyltransferase family protein [Syntrophales bacterium]|jgi:biotin-dependent carboxylase-like uncharacterized protein|nr:biotin-dependent carboxyltransferase family protein [Syntrophales bacterium]